MVSEAGSSENTGRQRTHIVRGVIYLAVFILLAVFMESFDQLEQSESSCDTASGDTAPPFYVPVYTAFLNWMNSDSSSQVSAIDINAELVDIQQNLCRGRSYLADVISAVATQRPSTIVVDKYFSVVFLCVRSGVYKRTYRGGAVGESTRSGG